MSKIFQLYDFPSVNTFSDLSNELRNRGASYIDFDDPIALFNVFVEFILLNIPFKGLCGQTALTGFLNYVN